MTATREQALAEFLRSAPRAFRVAANLLRDRAEAEDVVQEALARVCRDFESVRDPQAWFFRVVVNLCMRTQRRRRWRAIFWTSEVDLAPGPDERAAHRELLAAVDRLPAMQRTAVVLRYAQELSLGEIAELLGIGEGTVKTHLSRGLARLRKRMGA
jgi:RNA polymerase sigma-70 factor, ECF subfamily